jgi:hypothetical protein
MIGECEDLLRAGDTHAALRKLVERVTRSFVHQEPVDVQQRFAIFLGDDVLRPEFLEERMRRHRFGM